MDTKTSTYLKGISSSKPSCLGAHVSCWECNLNVHHSNKMKQTIIFTPCSGVKALDFQKSNCTDGTFHPTLQKVFPKVPSMKSKRSKEVGQASNILDATKKIKQILYTLLITSPMTVSTVIFDGINDLLYVLVNLTVFLTHLDAPSQSLHTPWPVFQSEVKGSVASRKDEWRNRWSMRFVGIRSESFFLKDFDQQLLLPAL